jgi:hypothetical protein
LRFLVIAVQFDLKAVVDLRDRNVQNSLHSDSKELGLNFRSVTSGPAPTQMLGERRAASGRIDGLFFESPAMRGKVNLAVPESALTMLGSTLAVNDPKNNLSDSLP